METYIITPAENPRLRDMNRGPLFFEKKAMRLPIPVDAPARRVIVNAKIIFFSVSVTVFHFFIPLTVYAVEKWRLRKNS